MKKHRIFAAAASVLLLTGCAGGSGSSGESSTPEATTPVPVATEPIAVSIPEDVLGDPSDLIPELKLDTYAIPEGEGMEFIKQLKLGWNLGNTFDAYDDKPYNAATELSYEKTWCGQYTRLEHLEKIKGAGFRTIRIPVSWHNHMDDGYHISEAWMNRVKEVVDWARACDLYVILNTHHDNDEQFYYPDTAHLEQSKKYLTTVWTQIAETFRDYDDHLILESLNEPRLVGTSYEWWLDRNNDQCKDAVSCINTLNQLFVDTVRATGGENASRWLLCPGYDASADGALHDGFVLPEDSISRVIVSVHAYTPYNFALNKQGTAEWSIDNPSDCNEVTSFMDNLYGKFVAKGIPVLIGEFGAMNKDNLEARVQFAAFYTAAARARGMSCCWWDNNAFMGSGENFGLLTRGDNFFMYPDIVQAMLKGCEYHK